ncbi:hypothetical protein [Paenarthrobacter sp. C1]|uniref:hypothetical protein n=1 Tax=Paenarthrobacter sp. C1 TaxID=3400220 RepID=UPI003BF541AA
MDIAHQVLTRYYRLIVMDSGNTARAANWRRMIHHTNQLVVPVTAIEDRAEAARLTLQTLQSRGGHDAELARNAVVIVSESTDARHSMTSDALKRAKDEARRIADAFTPTSAPSPASPTTPPSSTDPSATTPSNPPPNAPGSPPQQPWPWASK